MHSKSFCCDSWEQLDASIKNTINLTFQPTLAIVFSSKNQDLEKIRTIFNKYEIDLLGCSTAGEIVDDALYENSIAVLLMDMDRSYYKVKITDYKEGVYQATRTVAQFAKNQYEQPGILVVSGGFINAQEIVEGINSCLDAQIPIYGGLAGDDLEMIRTFAFTNELITDGGAAFLILDTEKIKLQGLAISGWKPVGGLNEITRAEGNKVYEINNEPAFDVFSRYFGLSDSNTKSDKLITIQTNYPFQILREGGHSILRSPLLVNEEERTITLAAAVEEGSQFRFSNSPGFEVIDQTVQEFGKLQEAIPESDAVILFSCKGRHGAFGPMLNDEISGIYNYWKKPLIGFLSYGEIGNMGNGICEFHNETCALAILKEV